MLGSSNPSQIIAKLQAKQTLTRQSGVIESPTVLVPSKVTQTTARRRPGIYRYQDRDWTLRELMAICVVSKSAFIQRIGRGWTVEAALTTPSELTVKPRKAPTEIVYYEYQGERLTAPQIEAKYGMLRQTFVYRINAGWSVADAIEKPAHAGQRRRPPVQEAPQTWEYPAGSGEYYTMAELYQLTGINRSTIYTRLRQGWDVTAALTTPIRGANK